MSNIQYTQDRVGAVEHHIASLKAQVKLRDAVLRLRANPDFRFAIGEEFMERQCARYARNSGDVSMSVESRQDALAIAQSAGHLQRFLDVTIQLGDLAKNQLPEAQATLDEVRGEEGQ